MSVIITPNEQLEFHRPFTRLSKQSILIKNPGTRPIIFKIKTTAPKQYCVRPNAGRIEANSEVEVQIILQPFKEEPAEDYRCKDKFLVQTAVIPEVVENQDITTMWSHIETTDKSLMHQHKIKCVFLGPEENMNGSEVLEQDKVSSNDDATSTNTDAIETPAIITTPAPAIATPAAPTIITTPAATTITTTPKVTNITTTSAVNTTAANTATSTIIKEDKVPVSLSNMPTATNTKKNKIELELKEALEKIKSLERELTEQRSLKKQEPVTINKPALKTMEVVGYSPQIVMSIALLVFIITYLFF